MKDLNEIQKHSIEIWKDCAEMVGDVLDVYLRKAEGAGGQDCGAYRLIFDIIKNLEIEFGYRIRP